MKLNPNLRHRRSIRLKDYDYSQRGAYFVTICVQNREYVLGEVVDEKIILTAIGEIIEKFWFEIPNHFYNVELDEFIVMPNHLHGIIVIYVGVQNFEPLQGQRNQFQHIIPKSLGSIIRTCKAAVTHWCNNNGHEYFRWQRNYYEHIIRNEDDLNQIREYISGNPLKWETDKENPNKINLHIKLNGRLHGTGTKE